MKDNNQIEFKEGGTLSNSAGISIDTTSKRPNEICFNDGQKEWLRIAKDGFYVDGEKVEDKYQVYELFNEWLKKQNSFNQITKKYD